MCHILSLLKGLVSWWQQLLDYFKDTYPVFDKNYTQITKHVLGISESLKSFAFQFSFYKQLAEFGISTDNILSIGVGKIVKSVILGKLRSMPLSIDSLIFL